MEKEKLDKNYLNWEMEFKKKVLLYMNYVIGTMVVMEGIASYQVIYILLLYYIYIYIYRIWVKYFVGNIQCTYSFLLGHSMD